MRQSYSQFIGQTRTRLRQASVDSRQHGGDDTGKLQTILNVNSDTNDTRFAE